MVPKKSATAKPVPKTSLKSKKHVQTLDSESELDDSTIYSVSKLREKSEKSKKKTTVEKTKSKKEDVKPAKPTPSAAALSSAAGSGSLTTLTSSSKAARKMAAPRSDDEASLMDTDSEEDVRYVPNQSMPDFTGYMCLCCFKCHA